MRSLEWRDIGLEVRAIRLRPENSKNRQGRVVKLTGELMNIIARARDNRRPECPLVFHDNGTPIGDSVRLGGMPLRQRDSIAFWSTIFVGVA